MNRRQWKKACKKAAAECERRWPGEYDFGPADGEETVYSPPGYEPTRVEGKLGRRYTSPPRGTPLIWERTSYEYEEYDCRTALEVLTERDFVESTDWAAMASDHRGHES